MEPQVFDFIKRNRVAVFTLMCENGMPHGAALHYSFNSETQEFYISTSNESRKCGLINKTGKCNASGVLGISEEEWITLQLEGEMEIVTDQEELARIQQVHYAMHPNSEKFKNDPHTIFLRFKPTWYRYTDFTKHPPLEIYL